MGKVFKFGVPFVVAMACAILTFLFANDSGMGNVASSVFSGVYCGAAVGCAYNFGTETWSSESWLTVAGGVLGGILGGILFAFAG